MLLQELYDISRLINTHKTIQYIARIHDNVILLRFDTINYCMDLNKNNPQIYIIPTPLKEKYYNAPFDIALSKHFYKSQLISCKLDGMNKILIMQCMTKNAYKSTTTTLYLEFLNRYSNAIIVSDNIIIAALRFSNNQMRPILPKVTFTPMPQPNFTKILKEEEIANIPLILKENYHKLQQSLILQKRNILTNNLESKKQKLQKLLDSLPKIQDLEKQRDTQFHIAHFILSNIQNIPNYATHIDINSIKYQIPQEKKPSLVSDKLFKQVKKLKQKILHINLQKENIESKITFLHNQINFITYANLDELNILTQKKRQNKKEVKKHYESFYIDGIRVSMGRNASENVKLLQDSKGDFIWLHILNIPSSHLIIHANKADSHIIEQAGILLARLNGIKDNKIVIDYTKRKFVKMIQDANVVYSKEKKLHIHLTERS